MFDLLKNTWFKIDGCIFSKCQNFSEKYQRKTGKTNFLLAKTLWYISVTSCVLFIVSLLFFAVEVIPLFLISLFSLALIIFPLKKAEKIILESFQNKSETLPAEIIELRKHFSFGRRLWLFTFFVSTFLVLFILLTKNFPFFPLILVSSYYIIISFSFYFASCETIPPVKGKVWQTIKGWFIVKKLLPVKVKA